MRPTIKHSLAAAATFALMGATTVVAGPAHASALTGTLVFIRQANVWIARPDGSGARALTTDGTAQWPYRSPSQDDAGHVVAIAGGAARDTAFVRMDQNGTVLQAFAPPIASASILFAQVSPDGSKIAYGALFGTSDCADFADCYTFFDHTVHYSSATGSVTPAGTGEASDVGWATWAGNARTILETTQLYRVDYQAPTDSDATIWFEACQNFDPGCNDEDHFQYEPTVSRDGNRYATSEEVLPWSSSLPAHTYLTVLTTSGATSAGPPAAPTTGCAFEGAAPLTEFPGHDELTISSPTFSPDGTAVAFGTHDGAGPDTVQVATFPDLADCGTATRTTVLTDAAQPQWSPAPLSPYVPPASTPTPTPTPTPGPTVPATPHVEQALVYPHAARHPRVKGVRKAHHRLHLSMTARQLRRAFKPDASRVSYRWLRNGHRIRHATHARYRLVRKDRGHRISVVVTGHRDGYRKKSITTKAVRIR